MCKPECRGLATYMGHVGAFVLCWDPLAAPELMALAAGRLEKTLGDLP